MPISPNTTLAHYTIISKIGSGGMGEVYLAHDPKLDRKVAIKFLPESSITDEQAKKRLVREAKAAAKLDHPNVCSIYEVGEANGRNFIVMQYVEGLTLAERLADRALDLQEVLTTATQITNALAEAHSHGIIHRDIKPQNIMLTAAGQVKVLDFGLARMITRPAALQSEAPTESLLTVPGMIVGTVSYMSPEQAAGKSVDARSDIFSFGTVLYEMVTGQRPFGGDSPMETLAAILNQEPPPLPAKVPPDLAKIIQRCLRKDSTRRYQTMADLKVALEDLREESRTLQQIRKSSPRAWLWAALLVIAVMLGVAWFAWRSWRTSTPAEPLRATALTTLPGVERSPSLNPDATQVVFAWLPPNKDNQDLYVQVIGSGSPLHLTSDPLDDYNPVWSPDGRWIAFFRSKPPAPTGLRSRELRLIPPLGGPERKVATILGQDFPDAQYLAWSPDSKFLVVTDSMGEGLPDALVVVSVETGDKTRLTNPESPVLADTSPAISPDGLSLVFLRRKTWGSGELEFLKLSNALTSVSEPKPLTSPELGADHPAWMPDGKEIILAAKGALWRLDITGGGPTRIPYIGEEGLMPAISRAQPGKPIRLIYVHSVNDANFWRVETPGLGLPSTTAPVMAISSTKWEYHCKFSPDGRRVAFASERSGEKEIWVSDPDGSNAVQLTSMRAQETMCPYWSPDGKMIAFSSNLEGELDIYLVPVSGGKPRRLTFDPAIDVCPTFSRDGKSIYFASMRSGDYRVWKMDSDGRDAVQVTANQGGTGAIESAEGDRLYYNSVSVEGSVWRQQISGGQPIKILDGLIWFNYSVGDKGIYYIDRFENDNRLQYFNFGTSKSTMVAHNLGEVSAGLTATSDGKTILFTRVDSSVDDLMLVENFR